MKKILVIDDLPENVFMLQDRLEHEGFEVLTAYDGYTGIDKAKNELGYNPVITVEEGIKELAASFKLNG